MVQLSPIGQFPALVDGDREIVEANAVVECLDRCGNSPQIVPAERDAALAARMVADVFEDYAVAPMQRIVAEPFEANARRIHAQGPQLPFDRT